MSEKYTPQKFTVSFINGLATDTVTVVALNEHEAIDLARQCTGISASMCPRARVALRR